MREAARRGVTSLHDMDGATALRSWRAIEDERGLALRVWVHLLADDLPHVEALGLGSGWGSDRLALGALKLFADGTLGSGTALLHEPELAREGETPREGVVIVDGDALRTYARRAGAAGMPLAVHAIGDRAVTDVLDALEATQEHWSHLAMRPRIEHAQLVRTEDLVRAASLGVALAVQPSMLVTDRDEAEARWGDRTDRAYAYRSMVDAGCGILLGSDAPIEDLRPLAAIPSTIRSPTCRSSRRWSAAAGRTAPRTSDCGSTRCFGLDATVSEMRAILERSWPPLLIMQPRSTRSMPARRTRRRSRRHSVPSPGARSSSAASGRCSSCAT
jgi:predicted amidohydrolase YtcJ